MSSRPPLRRTGRAADVHVCALADQGDDPRGAAGVDAHEEAGEALALDAVADLEQRVPRRIGGKRAEEQLGGTPGACDPGAHFLARRGRRPRRARGDERPLAVDRGHLVGCACEPTRAAGLPVSSPRHIAASRSAVRHRPQCARRARRGSRARAASCFMIVSARFILISKHTGRDARDRTGAPPARSR